MFCSNCGSDIAEGLSACPNCGTAVDASGADVAIPYADSVQNTAADAAAGVAGAAAATAADAAAGAYVPPQANPAEQQYQQGYNQAQGQYQQPQQQYGQPQYGQPQPQYGQQYGQPQQQIGTKSKLAAGLLGIFLGGLGIHKFYLGITKPAVIMLIICIVGWILSVLYIGVFITAAISIIGLIEGIIYLTKSDIDFYNTYEVGKKNWF